ncbi:MAG TPA: DUF4157 domain-containing protein, partial [Chitinophagaceae bacterium]|nr:DUF4157 domain-containing protein [Chitinophagaceae bacterium]
MKSSESKTSKPASRLQGKRNGSFFGKKNGEVAGPEHTSVQTKASSTPFFGNAIQTKLEINPSDDVYEKEADAMADKVMQHEHAPPPTNPDDPNNNGDSGVKPTLAANKISRLQRKRAFESPTPLELNTANLSPSDEMPLQRKEQDSSATGEADSIESTLQSSRGGGTSMPDDTREKMESGFGTDFSNVKVHSDKDAAQMNDQIGARAFTHGNDIYFNKGEYRPGTSSGDHLLAHELTHTVQQGGGVQKKSNSLQKAGKKAKPKGKTITKDDVVADVVGPKYIIVFKEGGARHALDVTAKELSMPSISLPDFKQRNEPKYTLPIYSVRGRGVTEQTENWKNAVKSAVNAKVSAFLENKPSQEIGNTKQQVYFFYLEQHKNFHIIGTKEQIQQNAYIPKWNRLGHPTTHQVDHIVEHQLGGQDQASTKPDNYELLDSKANMSSGNSIKLERYAKIRESLGFFKDLENEAPGKFPNLPDEEQIKDGYINIFTKVAEWKLGYSGNGKAYWTYKEIGDGAHLSHLKVMPAAEMEKLKGKDDEALIYVSESLGSPKKMKLPVGTKTVDNFFAGLDLVSSNLDAIKGTEDNGTIKFKLNRDFSKKLKTDKEMEFELIKLPGRINTYYIRTTKSFNKNQFKKFEGLSPVTLNGLTIDDTYGLMLSGTIEPDLPLFKGLSIDFSLSAGELSFVATIPLGILKTNFPKLFNVTDAFLQISYSSKTNIIGLTGSIKFAIEKIGEGEISASVDGTGFKIAGSFIFDKSKFDGQLRVGYSNVTGWSFGGTAKIGPDKIKGVKEAQISFDYEKETFIISGNATLTLPGLKTIKIHSTIGKEGDFVIIAEAELGKITGVKSGNVKIT